MSALTQSSRDMSVSGCRTRQKPREKQSVIYSVVESLRMSFLMKPGDVNNVFLQCETSLCIPSHAGIHSTWSVSAEHTVSRRSCLPDGRGWIVN